MHSSRMRTGQSLTVFWSLLLQGGGGTYLAWGGVPGLEGLPDWSRRGVPAWSRGIPGLGGVPGLGECTCLVWGVPAWSWGGTCLVPGWYLVQGGVPGLGEVYLPGLGGTCLVQGGYPPGPRGYLPGPRGGTCLVPGGVPGQALPPVNRMTHTCKNITLGKTLFQPVTMEEKT